MNNPFWRSPTYRIIQAMKATGNRAGVVEQWKESVRKWAEMNSTLSEAKAILAWLPYWQTRPFYTAEELAPMWPALAVALRIVARPFPVIPAARLSHLLDYGGLPRFEMDGQKFYIVEQIHTWKNKNYQEMRNALGR